MRTEFTVHQLAKTTPAATPAPATQASAKQISPDRFSEAIQWKRNVARALETIHEQLNRHDAPALESTLSGLTPNDLIVVEELYRNLHGTSIADCVASNPNMSNEARVGIQTQLSRKPDFSVQDKTLSPQVSHTDIAKALTWLGQNTSTLKFYEYKAKQGNVLIDMGKSQQSSYIPFVYDNRAQGRETELRGHVERDAAEEILKRTISGYSADELNAIQALSLLRSKVPGQGILDELANSRELSTPTKNFIVNESQKRGLQIRMTTH